MLISLIFAWAAVFFLVLTVLKWIARISGNRALNIFFRKIHIPSGILLLVFGVLHGLLAGNSSVATLSDFMLAPVLFTWNWGTVCVLLAAALAVTYLLRKQLKKRWMTAHRALTAALVICLALHLFDVGIQLPGRLLGSDQIAQTETTEQTDTASANSGTADSAAEGSATSDSADAGTSEDATDSSLVTFSGAQLQDGTYEGSASGYKGTITVSVTVSGGQVTDISVVSENDTSQYFSRAEAVLDDILDQQSLEIDTVTGATFSSKGLINAVADALSGAVVSGTLQVTSVDLSSISHGGR